MNVKKRLLDTILRLMAVHPLEKISVDMIVQESDLSRSTFYRYYTDKYALVADYLRSSYQDQVAQKGRGLDDLLFLWASHFQAQSAYYRKMIDLPPPEDFRTLFCRCAREAADARLVRERGSAHLTEREEMLMEFYLAGCAQTLITWLENGCQASAAEISAFLSETAPKELL